MKNTVLATEITTADDEWTCVCGNMPHLDGFFHCDSNGKEIEPDEWRYTGLYVCARCGIIVIEDRTAYVPATMAMPVMPVHLL